MKKLWLLLVALIPLCACDVCLFEDLEESSLQAGAKQGNKATMFSFPSVRENEGDWKVKIFRVIDFDNYNSWKVSVGDENAKPTIVSVYSANCEKCAKQAPYLDKLAQNFSPEDIDFVVIFLDFDKQTVANVPWLNELQHVKVAHNVISTCPSNNKGNAWMRSKN
ncbi:MAG: redoxin domain-containing protein [Elusimicrobiaceae bacterium]|nr:redoxin domain-containing protein [Elusimicrobiaceae bacterium]